MNYAAAVQHPGTDRISEILTRCAERFHWYFGGAGFEIIESLPCRTGTVYRVRARPPGPYDLALKVCPAHWSADEAETAFRVLALVQQAIASDPEVSVPVPLAWDDQIPSVCMSWVEGRSLQEVLKSDQVAGSGSLQAVDLVRRCGRAYGLLHAAEQEYASSAINRIARKTHTIGRRAFSSPRATAVGTKNNLLVLRGPGSAPRNVVVREDGGITLVDSPRSHRVISAHRALARFLTQLYVDSSEPPTAGARDPSMSADFERAFLAGYAETAPRTMDAPPDAWLLTLHRFTLARGMVGKHLRRGRWRQALQLCGHALRLRLRLMRISRSVITAALRTT